MPTKEEAPFWSADDADTAIHVDTNSTWFELLLDLAIKWESLNVNNPGFNICTLLATVELGSRFGFEQLPQKTHPFMHKFASSNPMATFVFAAKNDFPMLAAYAIDKLGSCPQYHDVTILNIDFSMFKGYPTNTLGL
jgi:hypothetical protein